jgi:hypothetical protein
MYPVVGTTIADVTRRHALSAMPDAPVVADESRSTDRPRHTLARTLRSLADRLEPPRRMDHALQPHPR